MNVHSTAIAQFSKILGQLDAWLGTAVAYAEKKGFDPNVLVNARLAPDQYALVRQVQSACDGPKFAAARLAGKEPPKHPDTEQTIDELRARIATCRAYLATFGERDFAEADERMIVLPFLGGAKILGRDYLTELAAPNFYFHVTTAYAILRHNGVPLGKQDFLGPLTLLPA